MVGQVGGAETTGTQVGRPLTVARQEYPGVNLVTSGGRGSKRGRDDIRPRGAGEKGRRRGGGEGEKGHTKWERVVELVHMAFQDRVLA